MPRQVTVGVAEGCGGPVGPVHVKPNAVLLARRGKAFEGVVGASTCGAGAAHHSKDAFPLVVHALDLGLEVVHAHLVFFVGLDKHGAIAAPTHGAHRAINAIVRLG